MEWIFGIKNSLFTKQEVLTEFKIRVLLNTESHRAKTQTDKNHVHAHTEEWLLPHFIKD